MNILTQIGIPALITVLSDVLGTIDKPATQVAAKTLHTVQENIDQGRINAHDLRLAAQKHTRELAKLENEARKAALHEINASLRSEIASADPYVRRMRPTFGYLMALTWAAQMFSLAYVMIFKTDQAGAILNAMSSLSAIWAIGLSVLGIYVYKRSEDKRWLHGNGLNDAKNETMFWNKPDYPP